MGMENQDRINSSSNMIPKIIIQDNSNTIH